MRPGLELSDDRQTIGRDPRLLKTEEFHEIGHEALPILSVIRAKCLDCCCGSESEVRKCTTVSCPLWPYRMGSNPLRAPKQMSEEQRQAAGERMRVARQRLKM
jgi:hypothetical protein